VPFSVCCSRPRSLRFATGKIRSNLRQLESEYGETHQCHATAERLDHLLQGSRIEQVFEEGLHEFLSGFLFDLGTLGGQIEADYRFNG